MEQTDYKTLGIAVAAELNLTACKLILINFDDMHATLINVTDKGDCVICDSFTGKKIPDFFQIVATELGINNADEAFLICKEARRSLLRYTKSGYESDESVGCTSCRALVELYEKNYESSAKELIRWTKFTAGNDINIALIGKMSAFFPAEYTIKKALYPMPFLPVDTFFAVDVLTDTVALAKKGEEICLCIEKEKKILHHNVMIRYKRLAGTELLDWPVPLAKKGDSYETLKNPRFTDTVIAHALDSIVLLANEIPYTLKYPKSIFPSGNITAKVQFALGIENDVPKLIVKNENKFTMLDIDSKIYGEE